MDIFGDSEEEDNNPFSGTNHLYASGIAAVEDTRDSLASEGLIGDESTTNDADGKPGDAENDDKSDAKSQLTEVGRSVQQEEIEQDVVAEEEGREGGAGEEEERGEGEEGEEEEEEEMGITLLDEAPYSEQYVPLTMSTTSNVNPGDSLQPSDIIQVIEAGEYRDPWGKRAIGYCLSFQGKEVVRRYSEFDTLRKALVRLLPTVILPPIPSKHSLISYFLSPLSVESDSEVIEKRKRLFSSFLNNCIKTPEIRDHVVFRKFLDPEYSWKDVLSSPPIVILPVNNLLAPPLNPTKPSPLHHLLPGPTSISRLDISTYSGTSLRVEAEFSHLEAFFARSKQIYYPLHRIVKQHSSRLQSLSQFCAELGAYYNAFSLEDNVIANAHSLTQIKSLSNGIEKIGHAFDVNHLGSEILVENMVSLFEEPLGEILHFLDDAARVLHFRKLKQMQYQIIEHTILKRETRVKNLQEAQTQLKRLGEVLQKNAKESPTVAQAVRRIENTIQDGIHPEQQSTRFISKNSDECASTSVFTGIPHAKFKKKMKRRTMELEPYQLTEEEKQEEIQSLHREIDKLKECFKLIRRDIDEVNRSSLENLQRLASYIDNKWDFMLKTFTKLMVNWISECLNAWKNARSIVSAIEV